MTNKPVLASETTGLELAIIGMSGRFPEANTIDKYWQNLQNGVESISFFTGEEVKAVGINSTLLNNPKYVKARAVLENPELFDASFFGFSPREAEMTDPQHRLFLECAWEALENAGYVSEKYGGLIGVYAGGGWDSYLFYNIHSNSEIIGSTGALSTLIGNEKNFLTTRVSYKLNLEGPSYTVQTACSTSLVAIHLACQSLLSGECDIALAGGVSIILPQKAGYLYEQGGIFSPDGHCRAFDAKAQGTVGGNGMGIVVLKRLADALDDGDSIHAVIKGSAINNDGSFKVSYTAPRIDTQAKVIRAAQVMAEVDPDTISYIETHGTGTALGDPIEIAALTKVFRAYTQKNGFCAIGSVKTNIGHLNTAAGVASLIKTVLALKHKQIPPSLHFEEPNPEIDFASSPFYVNSSLSEWKTNGTPRRAGVSSFGIGGTNAHVILEEASVVEASAPSRPWQLLLLSGKTSTALETATMNLADYLQSQPDLNLADVAYTLQVGRRDFNHRRMVVCQDLDDAVRALSTPDPQRFTHYQESCNQSVVFMFPGQGAQYVNMALELYQVEPRFREQLDLCFELLKPHLGLDLRYILYPAEEQVAPTQQQLKQTALAQPALFAIEYALANLWMSWGVHPQAMIGHSIGEYVAACLAGVFSLEDALALVAVRGRLMQQCPAGAMLSVPLSEKEIQPWLNQELSLAAINAPCVCVVSGTTEAIDDLQNRLTQQGVECRGLHTSHAFHSPMMEPILEPFQEQVEKVTLNPPNIPFISNVTGTWITATEATTPSYWTRHLRQTVRLAAGMAELTKSSQILLEVGPGQTLSTFAKKHQAAFAIALTSLRHPQNQQSDVAFLLNTLGRLWLGGVKVDWSGFYDQERRHRIPLPTYPFERQRYWMEPQTQANSEEHFQPKPTVPELWNSLVEAGKIQASAGIKELDSPNYRANQHCLERLCAAYMNQALRRLGAFSRSDDKYSIGQLFEQCQIIPRYRQLLYRWLDVLLEQGQLQQDRGLYTNLVPCSADSLNELLAEVRVRWGDTAQVVERVQQCGENLATVLRGEQEPLELFVALAEKKAKSSYPELPLFTQYKAIVRASLQQVVKLLPPEVNLRILEIGGGQGLATTELLPMLPSKQTNYTFTDVGGLFVKRAQQKFSAYPFVEYRLLDIEQHPTEQGYSAHSFDVVVAVNVLHITRKMGETLEHVRSLLAPGGFLLLWEITQPLPEFDITDGILMKPVEDEERSQGNPFLSVKQWDKELREHGFVEVATLTETEALGHQILVARASTSANDLAPTAFTTLVEPKDAAQTSPSQGALGKPDIADWFYIPSWKRSMLPQPFNPKVQATQPGCWLVFLDECGLGEKMVQRLVLEGQDVTTVRVGEQFSSFNESLKRVYTINPRHKDDYDTLFQELRALNKLPKTIVHLWSVTPNERTESVIKSLEKSEYLGFYSLLFLAQAIAEQNLTDSLEIGIVSNNMQAVTGLEVLCPEKALILGPCKVIPLEYPNISCHSIDVVIPAETWQEEKLIDHLLAELTSNPSDQSIVYRGNHRWVQTFEPVRLDGAVEEKPRLREKGVYLIAGGLGGVGVALAEYIAQTVQAKLILIGRSAFPNRDEWVEWLSTHDEQDDVSCKIRKLQAIEALGAEVLVISADVSNLEQMSAAIIQANNRFGQIDGVIHAAGVPGGGVIQQKTPEIAESALAPKVRGTLVLDVLFKKTKLDFFVLCSSLSSFKGIPGMVDYAAENTFLDAFAHYSASKHDRFTISINWDRWKSTGMAVAVEARHKAITGEDVQSGMTYEEGIEAFRRILCSGTVHQVVVSTQDFQLQIKPKYPVKFLQEELTQVSRSKLAHLRPNLANTYVAPSNEVEQTLAEIWQQILGIEQIGIYDNFFDLGGDSLFVTMLVSRVCTTFQIDLSYKSFFDTPTIASLAQAVLQGEVLSKTQINIQSRETNSFPLSFAQQRLWFLNQLEPEQPLYNEFTALHLKGSLDAIALAQSFNEIVQRHETLRTTFTLVDGQPLQVIAPSLTLPLATRNLQDLPKTKQEAEVRRIATEEAQRLFNLAEGPLLRFTLLQLGEVEHILLFTMHHIIADGWSVGILIRELTALYEAFSKGKPSPLPKSIQYADFAVWQRQWLQEVLESQLSYWKRQLDGVPTLLNLPTDHPQPVVQTYQGARQTLAISKTLTEELKALSRQEGVTLFITLLAVFKTLLYYYTGQDDIPLGSPIANRNRAELENIMGFFVNTVVLRTDLSSNPSFRELLERVREVTLGANTHQDLPFKKLVEELKPERNLSHNPLFQVWFVLQNVSKPVLEIPGLSITPLEFYSGVARYDLELDLSETPEGLKGVFEYKTDLFDATTIAHMARLFEILLHAVVEQPDAKLDTLKQILTEAEKQQQLVKEEDFKNARRQKLGNVRRKAISGISLEKES